MTCEPTHSQDFNSYIQKHILTLAGGIKASGVLPVGSARNNFNTCFPAFSSQIKPYSDQVQNMVSTLLTREGIKQSVENCDNEEKIDLVVDGVNKILDRVRDNLDIFNGIKSIPVSIEPSATKESSVGSWNKDQNRSVVWKTNHVENFKKPIHVQKVMKKPQLKFDTKIDNTDSPFEPTIRSKPNAVKPLAIYLERSIDGINSFCHPYMHELNSFQVPQNQLGKVEPVKPADIDSTCYTYVDNEEALADMVNELKCVKELAIDLEYHNYRSFHGFTCLLQMSSRTKDYIIDTIALRSKLQVLNEFFTDPKIVKVLHGANSDVIWLQKDLNLYLVNMFDTYLASTMLNFPRLNLAYLLKHYCDVDTDKRYQLYDWRVRPLPEAALFYARSDTHYLLHIYDQLRNELIDKASGLDNLLLSVYSRSTDLCKKRYERTFDANGHLALYKESKQTFDGRQMHALKLLYHWRDKVAREQDESTGYVLPNHMLMQIAEILPREMQGILACCNPVPVLVRQNLSHLHQLIALARSQSTNKVSGCQDVESMTSNKQPSLSKLRCPHDFSHHDDFRDNLATLLTGSDSIKLDDELPELKLSVFDEDADEKMRCEVENEDKEPITLKSVRFVSPYERYKRTLKFEIAQTDKDSRTERDASAKDRAEEVPSELEEHVHIYAARSARQKEETVTEIMQQSSRVDEIAPTAFNATSSVVSGAKRKQKILSDQMLAKKCAKYDEFVGETASKPSQTTEPDSDVLKSDSETTKLADSSLTSKAKKKNRNDKTVDSRSGNIPTANSSSFKPFDYAKANYDKFINTGQKNLKALLNSKITFGAKKKNKNMKQKQKFQREK